MKRFFILFAIVSLYNLSISAQKKYEMVVEKTDGSEIVINVEDIVRTYFRERTNEDNPNENFLIGEWQECDIYGTLKDDAVYNEVIHINFNSDGTAGFWAVTKGQVLDNSKYSLNYTYTLNGNSGTMYWNITASPIQSEVGQNLTLPFTYKNEILLLGNVYLKKKGNGGNGGNPGGDPSAQAGEAIDLGLSVKWASYNVGANKAEDIGGYYAWGETEEKDFYGDNYAHSDSESKYHDIGTNISGTQYDVARAKWGGSWRMPTIAEFRELVEKCTLNYTSMNGVNGLMVTGPNGNTIFFPVGGRKYGSSEVSDSNYGLYWSATIENGNGKKATARMFIFFPNGKTDTGDGSNRISGMPIRPVTSDATWTRSIQKIGAIK